MLLPIVSFSQKKVTSYFRGYENPTTIKEAEYYRVTNYDANGKPIGIVREYYFPHQLKWQGKLISDAPYDIYDSVCTSYYPNGKVEERQLFIDSLHEGNDSGFYESGKLKFVEHFKNGNNEGEQIAYYESGNIAGKSFYVNGKRVGTVIDYFEDGNISCKSNFVNGCREGKTSWYYDYQTGRIKQLENYHLDTLNGISVSFYESGNPETRRFYKMGKNYGTAYGFFDSPNDTSSIQCYSTDEEAPYYLFSCFFYSGNKLKEKYSYDSIAFLWEKYQYYENGKLSSFEYGLPGSKEGQRVNYFPDGKLSSVRHNYEDGSFADTSWYENGKIKMAAKYDLYASIESGISYDSTGKKKAENFPDSLKLHVAKDNISCTYGLKNDSNNWVVAPRYAEIEYIGNGFYEVNENEKRGILDFSGKEIISPQYERIRSLASTIYCSETCGHSCGHSGWWDIDYNYYYGLFVAEENGKYGLINIHNKIILPFEFNEMFLAYENGDKLSLAKEKPTPEIIYPAGMIHDEVILISFEFGVYKDNPGYLYGYGDTTGFFSEIKYPHSVEFCNGGLVEINADTTDNKDFRKNKNGLVAYDGKIILPPVYDNFTLGQNYFLAAKNGKSGLYDANGKMLLDTIYQWNRPFASSYNNSREGEFAFDSMAVVVLKHKSGIIARNGQFILPCQYDSLNIVSTSCVIYKKNGKYGLLGKNRKPVSAHMYTTLTPIYVTDGYKYYDIDEELILAGLNGKYGVINTRDSIVIPFKYSDAWFEGNQSRQIIMTTKDSLFSFDLSGNRHKKNPRPDYSFQYGFATFSPYYNYNHEGDYRTGIVNRGGKIILQPFYKIVYLGPDAALFQDSLGELGIIPVDGHAQMLSAKYHSVEYDGDKYIRVLTSSGKAGLISTSGKLVLDTAFYFIKNYDGENFWVKTTKGKGNDSVKSFYSGDWGLIDSAGKFILQPEWKWPAFFTDTIAILENVSGNCLVKSDGKILLAGYDTILRDVNGFFIVEKNKKYGVADRKGNLLDEPRWNKVSGFSGNAMFCYNENGNTDVIDTTGKIIVSADFSGMNNNQVSIDSLITFYERNYSWNKYEYSVLEKERLIEGYDLLKNIDNAKVQTAARNFVLAVMISNDTSFEKMEYENLTLGSDDFYWDGKSIYSYGPRREKYYENRIEVVDVTQHSFSLFETKSVCTREISFSDRCDDSILFLNYAFIGDSVYRVTLTDLFDTTKNYKSILNGMIYAQMTKIDNTEISCSNPDSYMTQIGGKFILEQDSIVFYLPKNQWNFNMPELDQYVRFAVGYYEINDIINQNGFLVNFLPQKSKKKKVIFLPRWPFVNYE